MSSTLKKVPTDQCDYPSQPRSKSDPEHLRGLGESMKSIGQQVPIIGYTDTSTSRFIVGDGGSRVEAAKLYGIRELLALDLGKKPTPLELLLAQAAIDIHKRHFPPMDRARVWHSIKQERGCTAKELAKELGVSDSLVGDYLSLMTLPAEVQEQVNNGTLHMSKACLIAQAESDPERQRQLAVLAKDMARTALAAKVRQKPRGGQQSPEIKVCSLRCPLPSGSTVTIKGHEMTLDDAINALTELLKAMKKANEEGLDGSTFSRICRDKAKA